MDIYGDLQSGNCLKVKYTADFLGLIYKWHPIDITKGESQTEAFLRINPTGQVPVVVLQDGKYLAQSNAIIRFLANRTTLLPNSAYEQAKVDEWLFWEQYSHEPYIAVCRYHMVYLNEPESTREQWRVERGEKALDIMENKLLETQWLAGPAMTVADIALLSYTRLANEGGFDLSCRPNIQRWIIECEKNLNL